MYAILDKEVRPLLEKFDKIRSIIHNESISLPSIVVVGNQSFGKSSVLESISKINLPRG